VFADELEISESSETFPFPPKAISCIECKNTFVFSSAEQDFFYRHGLSNEPKRCPHCRVMMRMRREGKSTDAVTQTECAACGEKTTVPFLPREEKKIYCFKAGGIKTDSRTLVAHD
jgi:CxxC-x17-CxxC domain-containing protein